MPDNVADLTDEQRLALGRLAESLYDRVCPTGRLGWLNTKLGVSLDAPQSIVTAADNRNWLFWTLYGVHKLGKLAPWLSLYLELYISLPSLMDRDLPSPWVPTSVGRLAERTVIVEGVGRWASFKRALLILGYDLSVGRDLFGDASFAILPSSGGSLRQPERDRLRAVLQRKYPAVSNALKGAYEAFGRGSDGNRQACDSMRNAFDNLLREATDEQPGEAIRKLSNDSTARKDFLQKLHHLLGARGTHADDQPSDEDTLLLIRTTEDALIWVLQRTGEW